MMVMWHEPNEGWTRGLRLVPTGFCHFLISPSVMYPY